MMKYNIYHTPLSQFNGRDARNAGEWPGKHPCKFKSLKCIIRPLENDIFLPPGSRPDASIITPKRRYCLPSPSKEYVFRSCSKHVPPPHEDNSKKKIEIYPHDDYWTYSFRPVDYRIPLLKPHYFPYTHENKYQLLCQMKLRKAKEDFSKRLLKELRSNSSAEAKEIYKEVSESEYVKQMGRDNNAQSQKNILHNSMKKILSDDEKKEDFLLYITKIGQLKLPKIEVK